MKTALIVILALILVGGGIYAYRATKNNAGYGQNVVCTMDAKLCPDGSYVGRVGPKCDFAPCPVGTNNSGLQGVVITGSSSTTTRTSTTTSTTTTSTAPKSLTVTYTDSGFSPKIATIAKGGKITFLNKSSARMWVASDPHPTHTNYPGFDELSSIGLDGTWTFTFTRTGTWGYHNHISSFDKGTIVVK